MNLQLKLEKIGNNGETYVNIYNKALNVAYNKETVAEIMKYVI